jgi:hypothetical protein
MDTLNRGTVISVSLKAESHQLQGREIWKLHNSLSASQGLRWKALDDVRTSRFLQINW